MPSRHNPGQSTRPNTASAARVSAATVGAGLMSVGDAACEARACDPVQLNSGGKRQADRPSGRDTLGLVSPKESANTDCPEARMAGDSNNNNTKINKLR
jgi:hypothetical protein